MQNHLGPGSLTHTCLCLQDRSWGTAFIDEGHARTAHCPGPGLRFAVSDPGSCGESSNGRANVHAATAAVAAVGSDTGLPTGNTFRGFSGGVLTTPFRTVTVSPAASTTPYNGQSRSVCYPGTGVFET